MAHVAFVESKPTAGFELLRAAAELGHEITFVANSLEPYLRSEDAESALSVATDVITGVTTADTAALLDALQPVHADHPLDALTTISAGHLLPTAEAARKLCLPHEDPQVVARLRDKYAVRAALAAAGVPQPAFRHAATAEEAVAAADELGLPVVVKPSDGYGSRGVGVAGHPREVAELARAITESRDYGRSVVGAGAVLVEQYVQGPVVSCEMLTVDGLHQPYGCTDRILAPPPHPVELGGCFPAPLPPDQWQAVLQVCTSALDAVGVRRAHTHTELVLGPQGPQIVEINGRLVGGYVPEMMNLVLEHGVYQDVVELALGGSPRASATRGAACIRAVTAPTHGILERVDLATVRTSPGVARVLLDAEPGRPVGPARTNRDRLGFLITTGEDAAEARATADAALARAVIHIRPEVPDPGRPA
jgi:biotin carboxylase